MRSGLSNQVNLLDAKSEVYGHIRAAADCFAAAGCHAEIP
jgi:hypothetical protein